VEECGFGRITGMTAPQGGVVSPAAKLLGFVILLVLIFLGAHEAGSLAGPVRPTHSPPGSGSGSMNMGSGPALVTGWRR
jgi:hypothetical protein